MADQDTDFRKALARRDLKKGLHLASTVLSEDTIRDLVDEYFSQ